MDGNNLKQANKGLLMSSAAIRASAAAATSSSSSKRTRYAWSFSSVPRDGPKTRAKENPSSSNYNVKTDIVSRHTPSARIIARKETTRTTAGASTPAPGQYNLPSLNQGKFFSSSLPRDTSLAMKVRGRQSPDTMLGPSMFGAHALGGSIAPESKNGGRFQAPRSLTPGPGFYDSQLARTSNTTGTDFGRGPRRDQGSTKTRRHRIPTYGPYASSSSSTTGMGSGGVYGRMTGGGGGGSSNDTDVSFRSAFHISRALEHDADDYDAIVDDEQLNNDRKFLQGVRNDVNRIKLLGMFGA